MNSGFNIIIINSVDAEVDRYKFHRAIRAFNAEYTPAEFIQVTEVQHMSTWYDVQRQDFSHSFSVRWKEEHGIRRK